MPKRHLVDLAATATRLADNTRLWESLVEYDPVSRYYARLALTREHEAWLLTWVPGQGTDWHDHGGSAGAFTVVRGALTEEHAVLQGEESAVVASSRELGTGSLRPFGTRHVHRVTNTGLEPAVSIHVYAPALTRMNGYVREGDQLSLVESRLAGVSW
jgi:predicted metal-dependent enzyme (double-stranded beta helix superfamily)